MNKIHFSTFFVLVCVLFVTPLVISSASQTADFKKPSVPGYSKSSSYQVSSIPEKQPRWNTTPTAGEVNTVSVSSNGLYVVAGTSDGYLCLFNSSSKTPLDAKSIGGSVNVIDISDNEQHVAVATGNTIKVYNITDASLQFMWSFKNHPYPPNPAIYDRYGGIHSLAFSSDGEFLAVGTYYEGRSYYLYTWIHVFEVSIGNVTLWSREVAYIYHSNHVSVDMSSDGQYIVAGSTYTQEVYLFDRTSSTPIHTYSTGSAVNSVSISADGQYYVVGSDLVYYFATGISVPQWSHDVGGSINSLSISKNATFVVAATGSNISFLKSNSEIWSFNAETTISSALFCYNGSFIVTRGGNFVFMFSTNVDGNPNTSTHEPIWGYNAQAVVSSVSISFDGKLTVAGSGTRLYLFDNDYDPDLTPTLIHFSDNSPTDGDTISVTATISNIGNHESPQTLIRFYDGSNLVGTNTIGSISLGGQVNTSIECTLSPSGSHIIRVIADPDNLLYESNENNNFLTRSIAVESFDFVDTGANPIINDITATGTINSVSISSDGYYLVLGTSNNYLRLFFRNHTEPIWGYNAENSINAASISRNGSYIAIAEGNTVYVFSRTSQKPLWSFKNHPYPPNPAIYDRYGGIHSLAFSSDGEFLAVGTYYEGRSYYLYTWIHVFEVSIGNVTLWSREVAYIYHSNHVSVDMSSDGQYIVAGSTYTQEVYLFDRTSSTPIYSYNTGYAVNSVSMSADGKYFAVASNNYVYYFTKDVIVPIRPPYDLGNTVNSVSISSDGTLIAATAGNHVYLVNAADDMIIWDSSLDSTVAEAVISNDGNYTVARSTNHAYLFSTKEDGNVSTPEHDPVWSYDTENTVSSISTSSDGRYTAIGGGGKMFFFDVLHKADLVLTNFTFSDNTPNEDDVISIEATIDNSGTHKSYFFNVSFYDGSSLIGHKQMYPLSPGSLATASINYVCLPDYRTIKVVVDEENEIYESNKTNNQLSKTLYVNARPVPVTLNDPTDATSTSMRLSWSKNTELDFAKYEIYVSPFSEGLGTVVETITDPAKTSYIVGNLNASTTYYFMIRVSDTGDAFSESNQVNGTTLPIPVELSKPTNLTPISLDLSWTKNTDLNFKSYEIYKSPSPEDLGSLVATINDQTIITYKVTGLDPSTTYYFVVKVVNPQGLSSDSNQASETTATAEFTLTGFPSSQVVIPGDSASYTVSVTSQWGFSVHLAVSELPAGATPSFSPQIVTPNGTSTLTIATSASVSGGSYKLTITCKSGEITHTKSVTLDIIEIDPNDIKQAKTGTITFSLTKTLEKSQSFSIEGVPIELSARADISITMPVEVIAESNATEVENSTGAWIIITMNSKTATLKVTAKATAKIAELSESITKTWTKSFTTPLGTTEVVFDTFSIPAIDALIGEITIDLTPRAILQGHVDGNITVSGPGAINKQELQWTTEGSRNIVFVTFSEDKDIEVDLSSSTLSLTKLTIIMDVGASLRTIIGSRSIDLGSLQLPISTDISTKGSPDSITLAKFSGSTPSPFEPLEDLLPTELWIYVIIVIAVVAATITAALVWRRRHRVSTVSQETEKSTNAGGSV